MSTRRPEPLSPPLVLVAALVTALASALALAACAPDHRAGPAGEYRMTINELLLEDARTCTSGFEYPQSIIDGIGHQLVEELRCMDDSWLEFYTPCQESGCIWADGPQPHAIRPEVIDALEVAAASIDDFISISAGYRDVAMQYYSRWYKENCSWEFNAEVPGLSNHQGGRAVDVRYYDFWYDTLLEHGFEHPIPDDEPHFELIGTAAFRAESERLQQLSVLAFQRLWNRNNPDDTVPEDGVYGDATKQRLGNSPVEGFLDGACPVGSGGDDWDIGPLPDTDDTDSGFPDSGFVTVPDTDADDTSPDTDADDTSPGVDTGVTEPDADDTGDVRGL